MTRAAVLEVCAEVDITVGVIVATGEAFVAGSPAHAGYARTRAMGEPVIASCAAIPTVIDIREDVGLAAGGGDTVTVLPASRTLAKDAFARLAPGTGIGKLARLATAGQPACAVFTCAARSAAVPAATTIARVTARFHTPGSTAKQATLARLPVLLASFLPGHLHAAMAGATFARAAPVSALPGDGLCPGVEINERDAYRRRHSEEYATAGRRGDLSGNAIKSASVHHLAPRRSLSPERRADYFRQHLPPPQHL